MNAKTIAAVSLLAVTTTATAQTSKGDEAWGVIQITNIYDEEGTEEDRYMFSLKAISRE